MYATVGYHFTKVTPYLSFAHLHQTSKKSVENPGYSVLDEVFEQISQFYAPIDQSTLTLGVRWNFARKMSLSAQIESIQRDYNGISFGRVLASEADNSDVNLFSLGFDFTF